MRSLMRVALIVALSPALAAAGDEIRWQRLTLDNAFRSEGAAAADLNRDGSKDVIAGDVWYEAPDWKMHGFRPVGSFVAGVGYSNSFCNFTWDINADGWDDIIVVGFPGEPFHWYENPQNQPGDWKAHVIWHSACNESPDFEDVTGDGKPELILGSQPESQLGYISLPDPAKATETWAFRAVSSPGDPMKNGTFKYYHGLGVGDMNGDGRTDMLIPHGWHEAPAENAGGPWEFHPFFLSKDGSENVLPAANIHVEDLDLDGDQDVMMSSAHAYGVWWFENVSAGDKAAFEYRVIDESFSQTHALEFMDMNGDGQRDLVTGKRFFAHNGGDPGEYEPVVMCWYEIHRTKGAAPKFSRHEIAEGLGTGVGTQFLVTDMNGDERPDLVLSNKKGVNVLLQTGGGE